MSDPQLENELIDEISYDDQKRMARDGNHDERCDLAGREDVRPEILYYMAGDPDPGVRRQIARNDITPRHADLLLAQDDDDRVRSDVAGKIATTSIGMDENEQTNVYKVTMQSLEILAGDQLVRVRQILAESFKDSAGAPLHIVEKLALDQEISVSGPILELSPILGDEFLKSPMRSSIRATASASRNCSAMKAHKFARKHSIGSSIRRRVSQVGMGRWFNGLGCIPTRHGGSPISCQVPCWSN